MQIRYVGINLFTNNTKFYQEGVDNGDKLILTNHGKTMYMLSKVPKKYQGIKLDPLLTEPTPEMNKTSKDWNDVGTWEKEFVRLSKHRSRLMLKYKNADDFCKPGILRDLKATDLNIAESRKNIVELKVGEKK